MFNDISRGSNYYLPQHANPVPQPRDTRRTTPATPQPKRRSLMSHIPVAGPCLLVVGLASSAVTSLSFSLCPPHQTAVVALCLLYFLAHGGSLIFFLYNPSIRPSPHAPGRSVFFYCFAWMVFQVAGFVGVYQTRGKPELPDYNDTWTLASALLTVASVFFWACAVQAVLGRRPPLEEDADPEAMRRTGWWHAGTGVAAERSTRHEEMAHVEHVEFSQPPPVYRTMPYLENDEPKR